ncbi:MAG: response regulator, partial [Deltaproteobacteria bacterium]|nr:response regulator [Deltaproteobacteria bacterium]
ISEKPIELIADLDPSLPAVLLGDSTRLRQILINILGNAVKFTEKGFIRFSVSWEECPGDCVILSFRVEDSGLGIRGSDLGRLFVDFERLAGQGVEGTGLGLSIAKSLCRAMGGDIAAESVLGKGSVFTATVRQQIEDRYPMGEVWSGAPDRPEIHRPPFLAPAADILVVDDLPSNLLVAEGLLGPYGAMVTACRGGREAVEMASSRPFDLVFMDHMMPDLDGVAATAAIRAIPGCEGLPIVALTANAVAGMKEMFLRNGFSDFLPKPIAIASLAGIMDKWIPAAKRVVPSRPTAQAGPAEDVSLPEIEGLDAKAGLAMAGGSPGRFRRLLGMFCRDAMARLALLGQAGASGRHDGLAVQAHALKGSLASIGAARLAEEAACLEAAALAGDWPPRERLAAFRAALETLARRVEAALAGPGDAEGYAGLAGLLARLGEALACEDLDAIELAMGELGGLALCGPSSDLFLGISELVLRSEFLEAAGVVRKALDCTSLGGGE